jgi:hypothetical protein
MCLMLARVRARELARYKFLLGAPPRAGRA